MSCGDGFGGFGGWGWRNRWGWGGGWGFGWGGWGWGGWPWLGFWGWDPFWYDPWWGWPSTGYGYYGYPNNYMYGYPDSGYSTPDDNSPPPPQPDNQYNQDNQNNQNSPDGNWVTPNGPSPTYEQNSGGIAVPILIYMKDGAVYTVRDYWMVDGELHYTLIDGVQNSVDLDLVDLPRTNMENAKSGVRFIFKSEPSIAAPPPDGNAPPPAQPNSNQPNAQPGGASEPSPAPAQQIYADPQPEGRT